MSAIRSGRVASGRYFTSPERPYLDAARRTFSIAAPQAIYDAVWFTLKKELSAKGFMKISRLGAWYLKFQG
ncbi:MAG: hypothetical protein K8R67_12020 [Desulfobacteraceae bacterium]|nr:hypothetical protein [Desulfobacteraceae bacterium]